MRYISNGSVANERPILVISQLPPPVHGSTVMTQVFLETMSRLGYSTKLVDRRFSGTVAEIGRRSPRKILKAIGIFYRLIWAILRHKPVVCVFFVTTRPGSLVVDWLLSEALGVFRVPTVAYLHTVGFASLSAQSKFWEWIIKRLFSNCKDVVTLSEKLKSDLHAILPARSIYVVGNTVSEEIAPSPARQAPPNPHIVYMSNLIPEKGAKDFLELARRFQEFPEVRFSLIGASTDQEFLEQLQEMIDSMNMGDRISILGPVYGARKWEILANCTALVFPSRYAYEAQPLSIIEALHVGTPVVAYRAGAIEDCVIPGLSGWVCPPGDVDSMFLGLRQLLTDNVLWEKMSASCQSIFGNQFSRAAYERNWCEVLRETT